MARYWITESTGGNCSADVALIIDDRTGARLALVLTDGDGTAWSESVAPTLYASVYRSGAWWGDDDDREPLATVEGDSTTVEETIAEVLAEAGASLEDASPLVRILASDLPGGASDLPIYGACGVEGCTDCRPLYDTDNVPIPGTDTDGPLPGGAL